MKGKIFSRLKDYNHILDKTLEKKNFSEDAKNLLLSMIYKIENSYSDYAQIKGIFQKQSEFIDEIIDIVSNNCKYIFLVDPKKDGVKLLKQENVLALTDEKEQRIYSYPTEQAILYGIMDIKPKYFYIPRNYYYIKKQFQKILVEGSILNSTEVIRNFNGWSWNVAEDANINHVANVIYQTIRILIDEEFLKEWEDDASGKVDYIYELRKAILEDYGKELSRSLYIALARLIVVSSTREEKHKLRVEYERVQKAYDNMKDKTAYIFHVSEEKKKLNYEIERKDFIMKDRNRLYKEFEERNKNLADDKKIFNVSDLIERLQIEREKCVKRISELNELVKPANYTGLKNELAEKIQIMSVVIDEKSVRDALIEFQKEVIKCFAKNIENMTSKEETIDIIYKMRYYRKLRITENEKIEDIPVLFNQIEKILRFVITKSCKDSIFNIFCKDVEFNYKIIAIALDSTISNYENIDIALRVIDGNLQISVYENEILEKQEELKMEVETKDLAIKQKKQVPLCQF